ncbi:hypothetical protein HBI18_254110, partial [Parastagonospora nodorum]
MRRKSLEDSQGTRKTSAKRWHDPESFKVPVLKMATENAQKVHRQGSFAALKATIGAKYKVTKLLGQGTFGKVYKARDATTNKLYAIKIASPQSDFKKTAIHEIRMLLTVAINDKDRTSRLISVHDWFEIDSQICILMPLYGNSLAGHLATNCCQPFPDHHIHAIAKQLLESVAFLHSVGMVHTDIKPDNILLESSAYQTTFWPRRQSSGAARPATERQKILLNSNIYLIDIGSAALDSEHHETTVTSLWYRAPEVSMSLPWSFAIDMWSLGCILVELYTGVPVFNSQNDLDHLASIEATLDKKICPSMVRSAYRQARVPRQSGRVAMDNMSGICGATLFKNNLLDYPNKHVSELSKRRVQNTKNLK